ncbi:hypothetical protein DVH05_007451 [Phytophthora capsici]|nr:hypothetical protein DVH05_007451 [Phytophthora capsici]
MDETFAVMETRFTTTEAMFYRPGKVDFNASSQSTMPSDRSWDDDIIVAARIPRDKVILESLVSRGAFGEVYKGTYNGQLIAAKILLVDTRRSIPHVNAFMAEVKMSAVMDHPHIAKFIGVAWDSLSDLCSVTEFMEGGDLKALLVKYEEEGHPLGFNYSKVKIALHVAHALTYLHSLDPPVIHRDLKSRNILLSKELEAKLTDFGISRERIDATMTAGVGTSLWMAPEIMMGNQYDEMADMFSFGVVLSELSTHAAPYSHARLRSSLQQPMPRTVILQNVAAGKLSVDFSDAGPDSMVELGRACVAMDPRERPTAAEALYRLHKVLTLEFRVE